MSAADANGWFPLDEGDEPVDIVDVWLWDCEDGPSPKIGRLATGVRILPGGVPHLIESQDEDGRWAVYLPHENGEWISHYRPATKPPVMP